MVARDLRRARDLVTRCAWERPFCHDLDRQDLDHDERRWEWLCSWIRRRPGNLDADEQLKLKQVRAACPYLDALRGHVEEFAKMLTGRHGERLDTWIAAVRADDLPHLHTFANGLERDHAAVLAGLTLPHSSGAVEGKVGKIKFLKRLMFGRANYDLLRKMALLN